MHLAVMHGMLDLVEFLIDRNADQSLLDIDSHLAIVNCIDYRHGDCLKLILDRSPNLNINDLYDNDFNPLICRTVS